MQIQPYIFFDGRCDEALEFYKAALRGEVTMLLGYKDSPEPSKEGCGGQPDKVMHASVRVGDASFMAADGNCGGKPRFEGFGLSFTVPTEAHADRAFNALSSGGRVLAPLTKTFFSPRFGMVTDKFGVMWMVYVAPSA
jgi:PhnB protein